MTSSTTEEAPWSNSYVAPRSRISAAELEAQIARVAGHRLTDTLADVFSGVVLVINPQRQIVAINKTLLQRLGVTDPQGALGQRPGEALGCVFAEDGADGCGTGTTCSSCGAALAILASQEHGEQATRECIMTATRDGEERSFEFMARCTPLHGEEGSFSILTLQDISVQRRLELMQGLFLHDLMNVLTSLVIAADELRESCEPSGAGLADDVTRLASRILDISRTQRDLLLVETGGYKGERVTVSLTDLAGDLQAIFDRDELLQDRRLELSPTPAGVHLTTDRSLLLRVLGNMIKNALEASPEGSVVRVRFAHEDDRVEFLVWNAGEIPSEIAGRVFQRCFTTKPGRGRGLGAYIMKLFGERCLGGDLSFTTGSEGTTFRLALPLANA